MRGLRRKGFSLWKTPPAVFGSIKQRSFLSGESYEVCKKLIRRKKRTQKLLVKVTRGYLQDILGNSNFEQIWILQDIVFQTTQKQLPVPFLSLKSNTRRTGIKVVWRLLAKHVWKSSLEDWSTGVNFKNRLIHEKFDHCSKKILIVSLRKAKTFL